MRHVTDYGENNAYILANSETAKETLMSILDDFMINQSENQSFIFVAYHVQEDIILLHVKSIENDTDFDTALQLIEADIRGGRIRADDKNLKKALNDPQASTAKILLDYIRTEKNNLS